MSVGSKQVGSRPWFYIVMAFVALVVALTGFTGTFFVPLAKGRFEAPPVVFVHGALFFAWILLFVIQPSLIRWWSYRPHKILGAVGVVLALAMAWSGVDVMMYAVKRDFAAGGGEEAILPILSTCIAMAVFLGLVLAGAMFRGKVETHKRLMLLATLVVLWPAWFRLRHYFPSLPGPDAWFAVVAADLLMVASILACMVRDRLVLGRIHPVYLWVGSAIIAKHALEWMLQDTPLWRTAAHAVFKLLS